MGDAAKILDMYGREISGSRSARYFNGGLSNGAASLNDPSLFNWEWHGGSPDDDIVQNLDIVRQRTRDLSLNAPIVNGLINTLTTNVVGQGLIPEPTPDAELLGMSQEESAGWKRAVLRLWEEFAETDSCDVCGMHNFYELTQLVYRSEIESGDVFVAIPYVRDTGSMQDLKIQVIEADCVSDPMIGDRSQIEGDVFGGVEIGIYGQVLAYWVSTRHPLAKRHPFLNNGKHPLQREWVRVPAYGAESGRRNMLHVMRAIRPNQRRGVPILAPIVKATKKLDRYLDAELQAALVQALFTMAIYSDNPDAAAGEIGASKFVGDEQEDITPSQRFYEDNGMVSLGTGNTAFLAPGDKIEAVGVTHPHTSFEPFVSAQLKFMGASVGLPYEMVVQYFQSSFSASKAAINMATANFKVQRDHLAYTFCQPIYDAFMAEVVASGLIKAPGFFNDPLRKRAYCLAKWNGPGTLQLDPGKEIDAAIKRVSVGVSTLQQETAEITGGEWRQNAAERHHEQATFNAAPWDATMTNVGTSQAPETGNEGQGTE